MADKHIELLFILAQFFQFFHLFMNNKHSFTEYHTLAKCFIKLNN